MTSQAKYAIIVKMVIHSEICIIADSIKGNIYMKKLLILIILLLSGCSTFCAVPKKTIFDIAAYGNVPELQKILKTRVNVNAVDNIMKMPPDKSMKTPLMYAAQNNRNPKVITELIKAGAKVNIKDESGTTPLIYDAY